MPQQPVAVVLACLSNVEQETRQADGLTGLPDYFLVASAAEVAGAAEVAAGAAASASAGA